MPWTVSTPADRVDRRPAAITIVPSGTRRSSRRSASSPTRCSSSSSVPIGASRRAWSSPTARAPGRRATSATAKAAAVAGPASQAPPDATTRLGAGSASNAGVSSSRRLAAARTAAMRRIAPSPAASPQGAVAISRSRSRVRRRSRAIGQPADHVVEVRVGERARQEGRSGHGRGAHLATGARLPCGHRPGPACLADLEHLDPAAQHARQGTGGCGHGPAAVVVPAAQGVEQPAQRLAAIVGRRGGEERRARAIGAEERLGPTTGCRQSSREHGDEAGPALGRGGDQRARAQRSGCAHRHRAAPRPPRGWRRRDGPPVRSPP